MKYLLILFVLHVTDKIDYTYTVKTYDDIEFIFDPYYDLIYDDINVYEIDVYTDDNEPYVYYGDGYNEYY